MIEPETDDLRTLDERAQRASHGLEAHVLERIDVEGSLHELTHSQPDRRRGIAAAAVILLVVASVAVIGQGSGDDRSQVDLDELPELEPGVLRPLGPRDGKDSIQLPVTAEPSTGLREGDKVTVSGSGFQPGERVGIVQCAREAGGGRSEVRGGVDGCYVGGVQYADADPEGKVSGSFTVRRVLTTPMTGTVDCAAEADRCIVAIGALADYDRSGGTAIRFVGGGEPIVLPEVSVSPPGELTDGEVVHVAGSGFRPGELIDLMVCSTDPSGCWSTGEPVELESADQRGEGEWAGLRADEVGEVDGEVPVWRYLPGAEPGTYIDCAVSECSLRFISHHRSPAPYRLAFEAGGERPVAPAVAVHPMNDLAPGEELTVRGGGFTPGSYLHVMFCAGPPGQAAMLGSCTGDGGSDDTVADDGTFIIEFEIPDPAWMDATATTVCSAPSCTGQAVEAAPITCDGVTTECAILVSSYFESSPPGPPSWSPAPVIITFR